MTLGDVKPWIDLASFILFAASACFWLLSAKVRLTTVAPGLDELDRVTSLSDDLQRMGDWNFWAALTTAVAILLQLVTRFL